MNTTEETNRREFEEWALDKVTSLTIDEIDGEYFWVETQLTWEAWQAASDQLHKVTEQLADAQKILAQCLSAMPCGYVPNHTVENLPAMIADQTTMFAEEMTYSEKLEKQRDLLIEVLEITLNATVLNHRRERWHSDAEYALNKIKLNK